LNSSPLATKLRKDPTYINPPLATRKEGRIQHSNKSFNKFKGTNDKEGSTSFSKVQ